jgi:hypothetical protein
MKKPIDQMSRDELIEALTEARSDLKFGNHLKIADSVTPIVMRAIPWLGAFLICLTLYWMVDALAGEITFAWFDFRMLLNSNFLPILVGLLVGGSGVTYGIVQKRLKGQVTERLQSRIQYLEQQNDPDRTSSLLTASGETNPDDE